MLGHGSGTPTVVGSTLLSRIWPRPAAAINDCWLWRGGGCWKIRGRKIHPSRKGISKGLKKGAVNLHGGAWCEYGMAWHDMAWHGMAWHGMVCAWRKV